MKVPRPGPGQSSGAPVLSVEEVTVNFGGVTALDSVSLEVKENEIVSLIGPNGAGKTTLFNVVCGFVRPVSGKVMIRSTTLLRHRPSDLARMGVARTLQGVNLWKNMSVVENVMTGAQHMVRSGLLAGLGGLPRSSREERRLEEKARAQLELLGIGHLAGAFPDSLPYGSQKKVALARALMAEPTLLMLDEPASGLAADEMEELAGLLGRLRSPMSVLLVEHHMDFVMDVSDRIVVLDFGRVIASGTPAEVREDPSVTVAYLGEQVSAVAEQGGEQVTGVSHTVGEQGQ